MAGAFYQPKLVLCDYSTLSTLTGAQFADGMAEVIKYGMIFDRAFLDFLLENEAKDNLETVITRCVTLKRDVVEQDEQDHGKRGLLNFGHTLGHAIEGCSDFSITHGSAVAIGMVLASRAAYKMNVSKTDETDLLCKLLQKYHLPMQTDYSAEALASRALSDKKRAGDRITLILPEEAGKCVLYPISTDRLLDFTKQGLNA